MLTALVANLSTCDKRLANDNQLFKRRTFQAAGLPSRRRLQQIVKQEKLRIVTIQKTLVFWMGLKSALTDPKMQFFEAVF
jgi:hypothetical protein